MAKKQVYAKSTSGIGDFVYVDLLPEVRRGRQFNVNVISALLLAVVSAFFLIYIPYRDATMEVESLNSTNNDLIHELALTNEEFTGHEIDLNVIDFQENIDNISTLRIDFNNIMDDIELIVSSNGGRIKDITYDTETETLEVTISIVSQFVFNAVNNQVLNLNWVSSSEHSTPTRVNDEVQFTSRFKIGVDYNVE